MTIWNGSKTRLFVGVFAALFVGAGILIASPASSLAEQVNSKEASMDKAKQDVQFLREEEKLARDVYLTLFAKWDLPIFQNIAQAERRHMERMGKLIESYGIEDPVSDDSIGVFKNRELSSLYTKLVAQGSKSVVEALKVGATIEDLDIRDIRQMVRNTKDAAALDAYAALECGSRNHMRAFTRQLAARGVTYKAQYLSSQAIEEIVSGSHERCGRSGARGQGADRARGNQRGMGHGPGHKAGKGHGPGRGQGPGGGHSCRHGN